MAKIIEKVKDTAETVAISAKDFCVVNKRVIAEFLINAGITAAIAGIWYAAGKQVGQVQLVENMAKKCPEQFEAMVLEAAKKDIHKLVK